MMNLFLKKGFRQFLILILTAAVPVVGAFGEDEENEEELERERQEALAARLAREKSIKAEFDYTFDDISGRLVTISCESKLSRSSGSGFIAVMNGRTYLFTNQHVILGANKISCKTADGEAVRPRSIELSATRDIVRMELAGEMDGFSVSDTVEIDDPIGVFGNSEGGGVATELYGRVTQIEPEIIDVDADFVSGNSGSPALNLNQEVIGIASYVQWSHEDEDGSETHRYCYRLSDSKWVRVNWKTYNKKHGKLYLEYKHFITSIFDVIQEWASYPYSRMTAEDHADMDLRTWTAEHNRMINRIMRLSDKGQCSQHELDNTNRQIKNDMRDSADALSEVCRKRARQMRMFSEQRDLTGFLRGEFESFADRLEGAAEAIDEYGDELAERDFFSFR